MKAIVQDKYWSPDDVLELKDIDKTYPLSKILEAIGHVGEGHARGKVVITV